MIAITHPALYDLDVGAPSIPQDEWTAVFARPDASAHAAVKPTGSAEPDYECYEPVAHIRVPLEPAAGSPFMDA